jgi:hypothetical protein
MRSSFTLRWLLMLMLPVLLTACSLTKDAAPQESGPPASCTVTIPEQAVHPEDSAVQGTPSAGYYYINPDRSIWGSAWWSDEQKYHLRAGEDGNKMGWFRPAGVPLEISGRRLDGQAPIAYADVPCCYPTRFQATGVYFPTEGCWEVTARAGESQLTFVVWVLPGED